MPGINTRIFNGKKGFGAYDVKKADEVKFDTKTSTLETTYVFGDTGADGRQNVAQSLRLT